MKCWGWNYSGQLGDGTRVDRSSPVDVVGLTSGARYVVTGGILDGRGTACAIASSGGVKCWGANGAGQLGDGTLVDRLTPVDVVGLAPDVSAIAVGSGYACAATLGRDVKCWGANSYGQLGDGTTINRATPVNVIGLSSGASAVAAGDVHSCAVASSGGVKCWGGNVYGQLGDGTVIDRLTSVDVVGLGGG